MAAKAQTDGSVDEGDGAGREVGTEQGIQCNRDKEENGRNMKKLVVCSGRKAKSCMQALFVWFVEHNYTRQQNGKRHDLTSILDLPRSLHNLESTCLYIV